MSWTDIIAEGMAQIEADPDEFARRLAEFDRLLVGYDPDRDGPLFSLTLADNDDPGALVVEPCEAAFRFGLAKRPDK